MSEVEVSQHVPCFASLEGAPTWCPVAAFVQADRHASYVARIHFTRPDGSSGSTDVSYHQLVLAFSNTTTAGASAGE